MPRQWTKAELRRFLPYSFEKTHDAASADVMAAGKMFGTHYSNITAADISKQRVPARGAWWIWPALAMLLLTGLSSFGSVRSLVDNKPAALEVTVTFWNETRQHVELYVDGQLAAHLGPGDLKGIKVTEGTHEWRAVSAGRTWGGSMDVDRFVSVDYTVK
jgi:hypothetical protein